jgi:hypothetical protein
MGAVTRNAAEPVVATADFVYAWAVREVAVVGAATFVGSATISAAGAAKTEVEAIEEAAGAVVGPETGSNKASRPVLGMLARRLHRREGLAG